MKTIDRYVGGQLFFTTLASVLVLSAVLVLANAFKQLFELFLNRNTPSEIITTFLGYILPFSMTFTIPWGFLTAVLLVFGRMSAEHELTALRASGVSIPRVCAMVFLLAFGCVAVCSWISVELVPKAQTRMKKAFFELATTRPLAMFPNDRVIDEFPGYKIYVSHVEGSSLRNALVFSVNKETGAVESLAFAKKATVKVDASGEKGLQSPPSLRLIMDEVRCLGREPFRKKGDGLPLALDQPEVRIGEHPIAISLEALYRKSHTNRPLSSLTLAELMERIRAKGEEILMQARSETAAPKSRQLEGDVSELRWELSNRFSLAWASLAFGVIAIPLAITAQRKETAAGFLISLGVAFTYFFLGLMIKWVSRKPEYHPEWLVFLPNLLFFAGGLFFFRRLAKR